MYSPPRRTGNSHASSSNASSNSHWSSTNKASSTAAAYDERREIAKIAVELKQVLSALRTEEEEGQLLQQSSPLAQVSSIMLKLGAIQLSTGQLNWSRDITPLISTISDVPQSWLTAMDYACISRFITKASATKHLSMCTDEDSVKLYKLFIGYVKTDGKKCRSVTAVEEGMDRVVALVAEGKFEEIRDSLGLLVIHEVIRGVAQLLLTSRDKLQPYRQEALESLLPYCNRHSNDTQTRHAAIDAVGNIIMHKVSDAVFTPSSCESAGVGGTASTGSTDGSFPSKDSKAMRMEKAMELWLLHEKCASMLIDNLRDCSIVYEVSNKSNETGSKNSSQLKLFISCLRAITHAITASISPSHLQATAAAKSTSPNTASSLLILAAYLPQDQVRNSVFHQRFQSLVQLSYIIFERHLKGNKSTAGAKVDTVDGNDAISPEVKLQVHALRFLAALAAYNPPGFMSSWQIFLSDPIAQDTLLRASVTSLTEHVSTLCRSATISADSTANSSIEFQFNKSLNAFKHPCYTSHILSYAYRGHPQTRATAIACLKSMLRDLPLQKWFASLRVKVPIATTAAATTAAGTTGGSGDATKARVKKKLIFPGSLGDKVVSIVTKIFRFAVAMLLTEADVLVIEELLELASVIITSLSFWTLPDAVGGDASPYASYDTSVYCIPVLEELALQLLFAIMRIATSSSSSANIHALEWLDKHLGSLPPLKAAMDASQWPYYKASVAHYNAISAKPGCTFNAGSVGNSSNDSWRSRGNAATRSSRSKAVVSEGNFVTSICSLAILSSETGTDGRYSTVCRSLAHTWMSKYHAAFTRDLPWMKTFIDTLNGSALPTLRLLGCRMIATLISVHHVQSTSTSSSIGCTVSGCYDIIDLTYTLLKACGDDDHQARCQSLSAIGSYSHHFWSRLSTSHTEGACKGTSLCTTVLEKVVYLTRDRIGTVRAIAFKTLGEFVMSECLKVSSTTSYAGNSTCDGSDARGTVGSTDLDDPMVILFLERLHAGCSDSKLSVRVQAIWALGNLLLYLLPVRQLQSFPYNPIVLSSSSSISINSQTVEAKVRTSVHDSEWLLHCSVCMKLLFDSEKVLASSVRCLGFVTAGLTPSNYSHYVQIASIIDALMEKILQENKHQVYLEQDVHRQLHMAIETIPQKLLYSVCQALGFIGWVLVNKFHGCGGDTNAGHDINVEPYIEKVRLVLAVILRHGTLKIQLQSCKALVSLMCCIGVKGSTDAIIIDSYRMTDSIASSLDSALIAMSTSRSDAHSANSSASSQYTNSPNSSVDAGRAVADVPVAVRRVAAMDRALLVLIWVILDHASNAANCISMTSVDSSINVTSLTLIAQSLLYHAHDLLVWFRAIATQVNVLTLDEFSLTSPPLVSTAPSRLDLPATASTSTVVRRAVCCIVNILTIHLKRESNLSSDNWHVITSSVVCNIQSLLDDIDGVAVTASKAASPPYKHSIDARNTSAYDDDGDDDEI